MVREMLRVLKAGGRLLIEEQDINRFFIKIDSMGDNWNVRVSYLPYDWRLNEQI